VKKCIGCQYCVVACPYLARSFNKASEGYFPKYGLTVLEQQGYKQHLKGTPGKCVFCYERVDQGLDPSCVVGCPGRARIFGDLDDPNSEIARLIKEHKTYRLIEELGTGPKIYYIPDQTHDGEGVK